MVLVTCHELVEGVQPAAQRLFDQGSVDTLALPFRVAVPGCPRIGHDSSASASIVQNASPGGRADERRRREDSTR
jgi:hypothetical protein